MKINKDKDMQNKNFLVTAILMVFVVGAAAADFVRSGNSVTVRLQAPAKEGAKVVRLQVVNDNIIRVQATSAEELPQKPQSLIVVPQTAKPQFDVSQDGCKVVVKARNVQATVCSKSGKVEFFDANGNSLLKEAKNGKTFRPFRVPDREIGVDIAKVSDEQKNGLSWRMLFESPNDEAFYGLGQHQS